MTTTKTGRNYGTLYDAETGEPIRSAVADEAIRSYDAAADEGGVFPCDWRQFGGWNGEDSRPCFVDGATMSDVVSFADANKISFRHD